MRSEARRAARRAQHFYNEWSELFLEKAGPTFQSGLVFPPASASRTPAVSSRLLADRAGVRPGMHLLDAGCGVGGPAGDIAAAFDVVIDGVTISPVQARLGRSLAERHGYSDTVRLHVADFHHLPFADCAFDLVLVLEASGYSHDLEALVSELSRVLRPGGTLYIKDVFRRSANISDEQLSELDDYHKVWAVETTWTQAELATAMERLGMTTVSTVFEDISIDHFIGSMVDLDPSAGLIMNKMGEHFFRTYRDLPVHWGDIVGRLPVDGTTST